MRVRVLAFARLAELLGWNEREFTLSGATALDLWQDLCEVNPGIAPLAESTRFARNGVLVQPAQALQEGDEVALLPPVGGG